MGEILDELLHVINADERFFTKDGEILKNAVVQAAFSNDEKLMREIYANDRLREFFFTSMSQDVIVFDSKKLSWILNNKDFLPNSFTRYKNHIGLANSNEEYISKSNDVVLSFPYKDNVLEGGQTKDDEKRDEVFYNVVLSSEKIDSLLSPKVLCNSVRVTKDGEKPVKKISKRENLVIKGNNIITISSLLRKYEGMIKLIYIDPPYNTPGESNTFSYNNTFNHSTWLTFMKNRLEISRKLLSKDGVICIAIDDCEYAYLKVLSDEIFGRDNFLGSIVVKSNPSGVTSKAYIATCHEYLLLYGKDAKEVTLGQFELNEKQESLYKYTDKSGLRYKWRDFMRTGGTSTPEERPNSTYPIYYDPKTNVLSLNKSINSIEIMPIDSEGRMRVWRQTPSSFTKLNEEGKLKVEINKTGQYKIRIKDKVKDGMMPTSMWTDSKYSATHHGTKLLKEIFNGEKVFSYPKSIYAVQDVIKITTSDDDIILDYFGGSGTTAHATILQNIEDGMERRFIICEQMDYIKTVTAERIKRVLNSQNNDNSFIYCELMEAKPKFIELLKSDDKDTIDGLFEELIKSPYLNATVSFSKIKENEAEYNLLSITEKKQLICELLDWNVLYINLTDVEDKSYGLTEEVIEFNRSFYELPASNNESGADN